METTMNDSITDKILNGIKAGITEVEELRLQAALGKMEARDLYEDSKKKFTAVLNDTKHQFEQWRSGANEEIQKIKPVLESLQVQLALGKAETKEIFQEQYTAIVKVLNDLETKIRSNKQINEFYLSLLLEIKKFRIKLDILKLRYELKSIQVKQEFEEKKAEFMEMVNSVKSRFSPVQKETTWEHFQNEIVKMYESMKSVVMD